MSDPRSFFKLHNGMPENPKVAGLTDSAFRALIELWCYCSRNLTDGHVASAMANRLASATAIAELMSAGLVDEAVGGYYMHDYLEHQQSRADVEKIREKRREAGSRGGRAKASAVASAKQTLKPAPSKSVADTDTDTDKDSYPEADAPEREDVNALCNHLSQRLTANDVKHNIGKGWIDAARLLIDRDKRPLPEAHYLIDWATNDTFWKANILSMPKFRDKYDQLRMKAKSEQPPVSQVQAEYDLYPRAPRRTA